jgi:tRNA nucleotidyltransferase (CCA-adding enzyme)
MELIDSLRGQQAASALLRRLDRRTPLYLVGGAVRDLLLNGAAFDLDLVIEGDAGAFARRLDPDARVHDRFGTATFAVDGFTYDVARARAESYAWPGALPDVRPASLPEDLLRRDFTANAVALALDGHAPGELIAVPHALEDIDARRLRILHDRSFIDDPTRLFRLARYASRLRFAIEERTGEQAQRAIDSGALGTVSGNRVGAELRLLARERDPIKALRALDLFGLGAAVHPRLGLRDESVAERALSLLPRDGRVDLTALALLFAEVPHTELEQLLDALGFEASAQSVIAAAASRSERLAAQLAQARDPSEIARAARGAPIEAVALAGARGPVEQARDWIERLRHVRLDIDGGDLLRAGVPQGPRVGRGLDAALAAKLDGRAGDREQQLAYALQASRASE